MMTVKKDIRHTHTHTHSYFIILYYKTTQQTCMIRNKREQLIDKT